MLTFATKKLSTGSNSSNLKGQKEDAASFFCQRNLIELSWQLRVMYVIPSWDNISLHGITSLRRINSRKNVILLVLKDLTNMKLLLFVCLVLSLLEI